MKRLFILTTILDDSTKVETFRTREDAEAKVMARILKAGMKVGSKLELRDGDIYAYPNDVWITPANAPVLLELQIHEVRIDPSTLMDVDYTDDIFGEEK